MTEVGLLLFDDVDLLDFGGPFEVFLTADAEPGSVGSMVARWSPAAEGEGRIGAVHHQVTSLQPTWVSGSTWNVPCSMP